MGLAFSNAGAAQRMRALKEEPEDWGTKFKVARGDMQTSPIKSAPADRSRAVSKLVPMSPVKTPAFKSFDLESDISALSITKEDLPSPAQRATPLDEIDKSILASYKSAKQHSVNIDRDEDCATADFWLAKASGDHWLTSLRNLMATAHPVILHSCEDTEHYDAAEKEALADQLEDGKNKSFKNKL